MADTPPPGPPAHRVLFGVLAVVATLALLVGLTYLVVSARRDNGAPASPGETVATRSLAPGNAAAAASGGASTSGPASPSATASAPSPSPAASAPGPSPAASGQSPTPAADPVLVGAGDIADCGLDDDTATADLVAGTPGTVFTAGDNVYPDGTADQFRDCYGPTWGRFLDRTRPAAGNHDWDTKRLAGYLDYFGTNAAPDGKSWYSYDLGAWHIVVLDSDCGSVGGCGADLPQGRWLATDLAASRAGCTLAIWHHPRFSSGEHGNDADVAPFWRALYDAGADLVINGHDHDYERFAPQDPDGRVDQARGIREFVVGTGGAALRTFPMTVVNSEVRIAGTHGVIRLVLHPGSYDWTFMSTAVEQGDAGTGVLPLRYRPRP